MTNPDSPDYPPDYLSQDLLIKMQSRTRDILAAAAVLLERGDIEDEAYRKTVVKAAAFIENPTENLPDIMIHTVDIGQVLGGYEMQGAEFPPEIDAMSGHLHALQFINRIRFIEEKLAQGSTDSPEFTRAMALALDWATTISKAYHDNTFLDAFNEFKASHNL